MKCSLCLRSSLTQCCLRWTRHSDRCHLPIARVARSFSTFKRHYLHRITRKQKGVICPLRTLLAHSVLLAEPANFTFSLSHSHAQKGIICPSLALFANSSLLALLINTLAVPPCGKSGCHLVVRLPRPIPTIHQSIRQNRPQTAEI